MGRALLALALAGCLDMPDHEGTTYRCDEDPICPAGQTCIDGVCSTSAGGGGDVLPSDLVEIPASQFIMGCSVEPNCLTDARIPHTVQLYAFAIEREEVTQAQFKKCIDAGRCDANTAPFEPSDTAPVRGLTWENAATYCAFVGRRLPTEAEWERAARGKNAYYPWGTATPDCQHANFKTCTSNVLPQDALPAGEGVSGLRHLGGNVREWVSDWYSLDYYATADVIDPQGPATQTGLKVVRGGSYLSDPVYVSVWYRDLQDWRHGGPSYPDLGVRCAVSR